MAPVLSRADLLALCCAPSDGHFHIVRATDLRKRLRTKTLVMCQQLREGPGKLKVLMLALWLTA